MRIGFDITALYVATAGVFSYDFNLIKSLLEIDSKNDYLLLDYYPVHGGWRRPAEIASLSAPQNSTVLHSKGLRHYKLSRWHMMQRPFLQSLARGVDSLLDRPLGWAARSVMNSKLAPILDGIDVFHASDVLLWAQPGALNVCTIHDLTVLLFPEFHTEENRALHMKKFRFAQNHADIVITGSQATKTDIVTYLNIEPDRIEVVPYGVSPAFHPVTDRQRLIDALEPLGLEPDAYILHVGTLEPRKNLVRLLKAYHKVRQSDGDAVPKLALVGPIGWGIKEIVAVIDTLGLEDAVVITGAVNSELVPILYSGALFFVYPSLYEGFGLPPLESMACGTPVITSNVSSIPEVVGDAAVMIAPENISDLADAMQLLMSDDDQRIALRYAGNQRASLFSWRRTAAQTLRIYNKHLTI